MKAATYDIDCIMGLPKFLIIIGMIVIIAFVIMYVNYLAEKNNKTAQELIDEVDEEE